MFNFQSYKIIGILLVNLTGFLLLPAFYAWIIDAPDKELFGFLYASLISGIFFAVSFFLPKSAKKITFTDGAFIVTVSWLVVSAVGGLPFYFSGIVPTYLDAFFEAVSGFTTTGSTVLTNIESLSRPILLWRSSTQWIGGMGILVLVIAIVPYFDMGGMNIYQAEIPGPTADKLTPRIQNTAKILWSIYLILTVILILMLWAFGMDFFDSINHAFTTTSTGGFSTKNNSLSFYDNAGIHWTLTIFMFLSGINFSLYYYFFIGKLKFATFLKNDEFKFYCFTFFSGCLVIFFSNYFAHLWFGKNAVSATEVFFNVSAIITSTGFGLGNFDTWTSLSKIILLMFMFFGAMAGSTAGGIKQIRILIIFKYIKMELQKLTHPYLIKNILINGMSLERNAVSSIVGFVFIYLFVLVTSVLLLSIDTENILTAISAAVSALGNIGPGFNSISPAGNHAGLGDFSKFVLIIDMLMGRLELLTIIVLFIPKN